MALLNDLASFLQAQGLGTVSTTIFKGAGIPEDALMVNGAFAPVQDAVLALVEVPGLPPTRSHDAPAARVEQPVVQVISRGAKYGYEAARQKAEDAWQALDGLGNVTLGSGFYLFIQALQSPFYLKSDEMNRPLIVFNIRCAKAV